MRERKRFRFCWSRALVLDLLFLGRERYPFAFNARTGCFCSFTHLLYTCRFPLTQVEWDIRSPADRIASISQLYLRATLVLSSRLSLITSTYTKDGARNYFCIRDRCVLGEVKHNKKRALGKHGEINENSLISQALTALIVSGSLVKKAVFCWCCWCSREPVSNLTNISRVSFFVTQWSKPGNI